jgi:hypothetical protein
MAEHTELDQTISFLFSSRIRAPKRLNFSLIHNGKAEYRARASWTFEAAIFANSSLPTSTG